MHGVIVRISLAACAALPAPGALAQSYPSQPIKVVVPFTPGTGMDIIARTVGPKLSERLGQPIVVENKPGASGNIGAEMVARSAPDGHTVMITANTMLIAASLYRSVPYDPLTDFSPISLAAWGTLLLTANPKANIKSVADLMRSEEHTSELQSLAYLVCRLLLEKKKKTRRRISTPSC